MYNNKFLILIITLILLFTATISGCDIVDNLAVKLNFRK